jgi:hypothetical protein
MEPTEHLTLRMRRIELLGMEQMKGVDTPVANVERYLKMCKIRKDSVEEDLHPTS